MTTKQNKPNSGNQATQASLAIDDTPITATDLPMSFETSFAELQSIVTQMESGAMTLEASLNAYKRGDALLQFCQKTLTDVEQQVKVLNEQHILETYQDNIERES